MIEVALVKRQGDFLLEVDFCAPADGVLGLVGPSGAGKSTLFSCLAGHTRPDAGRIAVQGRVLYDSAAGINLPPARRGIGVIFQDGLLFPHLSVRRNLRYGAPRPDPALEAQLVEVLALGPLLSRRPGALSGGERQRVAIGRALMARPDLLLLDEPLSALDGGRRDEVMRLLEELRATTSTPMIYISHAAEEIRRLADSVVTLRGGRVVADCAAGPSPCGGRRVAGAVRWV
ncbi:molybdate transport system ATP-binding protein [Rhodovulum iodosum]|uniref:Molybdate transport system ATP-binding protein n=1 Tax=Rhodovulum iodosum TaxID=68291 RepID=A0ABV3XX20_9RHOB|nr:ATP-binding cassette domain-containing protein [Rhodovulum robiginosum]RSK37739.1 ATP-binding cassette domain-containing protein [Rhodovulum robiginosum]